MSLGRDRPEGGRREHSLVRCPEAGGTGGGVPGCVLVEPGPPVVLENLVSDLV